MMEVSNKMPTVKNMQGVSAQLEFLRKNDKRRHPAHCINAERIEGVRFCFCGLSPNNGKPCRTSKNCEFYEDKREN